MTRKGWIVAGLVVALVVVGYCGMAWAQDEDKDGRFQILMQGVDLVRIDTWTGTTHRTTTSVATSYWQPIKEKD